MVSHMRFSGFLPVSAFGISGSRGLQVKTYVLRVLGCISGKICRVDGFAILGSPQQSEYQIFWGTHLNG